MFSGIIKKENSPYFRGAIAFDNFCVAYYVAKNTSSQLEEHFQRFKNDEFNFSNPDIDEALTASRDLKAILESKGVRSLTKDMDIIYPRIKTLVENNPYRKPLMTTTTEVRLDKRIKRFQCRVAQGPLTPPEKNTDLYSEKEIKEWHTGIY